MSDEDTTVPATRAPRAYTQSPATQERRAAAAAQKRNAILAVARRRRAVDAFENITIESIAREAGMSVGAIYIQFESKEALFAELVREKLEEGVDALELALDYLPGPLADAFREFLQQRDAA